MHVKTTVPNHVLSLTYNKDGLRVTSQLLRSQDLDQLWRLRMIIQ